MQQLQLHAQKNTCILYGYKKEHKYSHYGEKYINVHIFHSMQLTY